jgi:hypothetical protein
MFNATIEYIALKAKTFLCIEIYDSIDLGFTRGEHANHYTTDAVFNDMKHVLKRIVNVKNNFTSHIDKKNMLDILLTSLSFCQI